MSRTDGTFPHYVKLDIDPDRWPDRYWEKSRRCTECGFLWPSSHLFQPSPCHGVDTELMDDSPSIRWPDAVDKLLQTRFERLYEEYNEGVTDDKLVWEDMITNGHWDEEKAMDEVETLLKDAQNGEVIGGNTPGEPHHVRERKD